MPKTDTGDDSDDEELEGYEPEYHPEADEAGELWCPHCGAVMHADSDRCPKCGDYVTPGPRPTPGWLRAGAIVLALLIVAGLLGALLFRR